MDRPLDLSSRYGRGDGINANKDRQSIYGHTEPTFDVRGRISTAKKESDGYLEYQKSEYAKMDKTRSAKVYLPKKQKVRWVAESIDTWEKITCDLARDLAEIVGVIPGSVWISARKRVIVSRYIFYREGERPSEDEIDDMLDRLENIKSIQAQSMRENRRYRW